MTRPHPLGDVRRHLTLLRRMAAQTGTDTVLAFDEGRLSHDTWADAVTRCRNCEWAGGCQTWLEEQAEQPRRVPASCANSQMLRALQTPG